MRTIRGTPASAGKVFGPAFTLTQRALIVERRQAGEFELEIGRLEQALTNTEIELHSIENKTRMDVGVKEASIFKAQIAILHDPELLSRTKTLIKQDKVDAAFAWQETIRYFTDSLREIENKYLSARANDIEDVGHRVLSRLTNQTDMMAPPLSPAIILAEDLSPADTMLLDSGKILAFCTCRGGPTSHAAILSKALGIPCIVAIGNDLRQIMNGQLLLVDGGSGEITIDPDLASLDKFKYEIDSDQTRNREAITNADLPAITVDQHRIEVVANVGSLQDTLDANLLGAEGIGLLRTEFLFLGREQSPSLEEQISEYTKIFATIGRNKPIVVRTLDIGGDKPVSYLPKLQEQNPFLGIRGIRLSLRNQELFEVQLSALLIAGYGYDIRIMFPMVSTIEEVRQTKEIIMKCSQKLRDNHTQHSEHYQFGIMIEVPSAALIAQALAKQVDFFSIGTNDLTQYTLAAERTGDNVAYLNDPLHPAVLLLIDQVIKCAHARGKWVGICGELAGDTQAIPLLVGMGVDELSASPKLIPILKQKIRSLTAKRCSQLFKKSLKLASADDVRHLLEMTIT
jgi:phosphoenolpyruvate-protein phosphotransferase (PTS system enzyme I)